MAQGLILAVLYSVHALKKAGKRTLAGLPGLPGPSKNIHLAKKSGRGFDSAASGSVREKWHN